MDLERIHLLIIEWYLHFPDIRKPQKTDLEKLQETKIR
jgi:hypothetical protein